MTATTLVALRKDTGAQVTIADTPIEDLRELSDAGLLRCVHCGGVLRLKAGDVRLHHFAHVTVEPCDAVDHEPESESHRTGKFLLYQHFREGARFATMEYHLATTDQRADVYVEKRAVRYALEFQQANNTIDRWLERHRLYRQAGVVDLWFLGISRYGERHAPRPISPYDPLPVPQNEFNAMSVEISVRELEKAILSVTHEFFYLDPDSGQITALLARDSVRDLAHKNTLRAYHYQFPLADCTLADGYLKTPLDPFLGEYRAYIRERAT
jgi:hypothetical protein